MDIFVVEFGGGIELFPLLIQTVDGLLADGERRIVIDLGALPFINSAALGYLVKTQQTLDKAGGRLGLVRVQPLIRKVLKSTQMLSMFTLFAGVDDAVRSMGGHGAHADPAAAAKVRKQTIKRS